MQTVERYCRQNFWASNCTGTLCTSASGRAMWVFRCSCGNTKRMISKDVLAGRTVSCGCINKILTTPKHDYWVSCIPRRQWRSIYAGARQRGHTIEINAEYAWSVFIEQNGKCALSGLNIIFNKYVPLRRRGHDYSASTASLDRINSAAGYVVGNIQWVHKDINTMKWHYDQTHFINLCGLVYKHSSPPVV